MDTSLPETADQPAPTRPCAECKQEKPFTDDFWKLDAKRRPTGRICASCYRAREARRRAALKATGHAALRTLPSEKQAKKDPELARERALVLLARQDLDAAHRDATHISPRKLSTAAALTRGADVIVREAPKILELLALYASDPASPHHTWALQLFADRILPQRAFAALAIKEAGLEEGSSGATPRVTINVIAGAPAAGSGRVITVVPERSEDAGEAQDV